MVQIPEVRADLLLEASEALATVDIFGNALEEAITNFQSVFATAITDLEPTIAALAVPIADLASTPLVEEVTANTTDAETAIGALDDSPIEIPVEADTSGAEASIGDLGEVAQTTAGSTSALHGSLEGIGAASLALRGNAEGATTGLAGIAGISTTALAPIAALATGIGFLTKAAIDDQEAQFRFNLVLGEFKDQVDNINVGNLSIKLSDLAIKVGSTDDALQNATAQAFQFAQASGFSGDQAASFASRIAAISARAVALNPTLGDVGEAANRLVGALASGRERALLPFALGLTQAQIKAQAASLGLEDATGAVGRAQLAFAGADLAVKKFGDRLDQDITAGSKNPIIQLRALKAGLEEALAAIGTPLIGPGLELVRGLVPVVIQLGSAFAALGSVALPVLGAITPLVSDFSKGISIISSALGSLPTPVLYALAAALVVVADGVFGISLAVRELTVSLLSNPVTAFAVVLGVAVTALGAFGGSAKEARLDVEALTKDTDAALASFVALQNSKLAELFGKTGGAAASTGVALQNLDTVGKTNIATATRLGQVYVDAGTITQPQYTKALQASIKASDDAAKAAAQQTQAVAGLSSAQQASIFTANAATAAAKTKDQIYSSSIATYNSLVAAGAASSAATQAEATAYATASQAASDYKASLDVLNSGHLSLAQAEQQTFAQESQLKTALTDSKGAIDLQTDAGNKAYASILQRVSGEQNYEVALRAGGATAEQVAKQQDAFRVSLTETLTTLGVAPDLIQPLLAKLGVALPAAADAGAAAFDAAISGPGGIAAATKTAADAALTKVAPGAFDLPGKLSEIGFAAGSNLDLALAYGITVQSGLVTDAAAKLGTDAEKALKDALGIKSPSTVFMGIGENVGAGLALGIANSGSDVIATAEGIVRDAAARIGIAGPSGAQQTPVPVGSYAAAQAGPPGGAPATAGPSQTNNFYGYSPQETAAVNGREWTRMTRFAGV